MKTEAKVTAMLEKAIEQLNAIIESIPGTNPEEVSMEAACGLNALLGMVVAYGIVLDCETEVRQMLAKINLVNVAEKLRV